ncbi:MAG: PIN domain-containing protein [Gammaproteobacteria bacterium]
MNGAKVFVDTNVLLYLLSGDEAKAERAEKTIAGGGVISVQVLNEFASVARRKLGMPWVEIRDISAHIRTVCTVGLITLEEHDRGLQVAEDHGFSVYDAMIVAAALLTGCATLYSEDMQDGQVIDGRLTIRNPFLG